MVLFEPLVWELSPFSIFNRFDHFVDIKILVLVDDSKFLENAGSVSELGLHLYGFLLQFFGQSISKLKYIIGSTFIFVVHECLHHLFHHFVLVAFVHSGFHVSEWGHFGSTVWICIRFGFTEHFLHHHFHHHFFEHVVLWLLLSLSKNKLNWLSLSLVVGMLSSSSFVPNLRHLRVKHEQLCVEICTLEDRVRAYQFQCTLLRPSSF